MNRLLVAVLFAGTACAADAATYTVDFDSYALGENLRGQDLGGVVLQSRGFASITPTGSHGILPDDKGRYTTPFIAQFTTAEVTSVSIDMGDFGGDADSLYLEAYDVSGRLIWREASYLSEGYAGMRTLSLTSAVDIASIRFYAVGLGGENSIFADNLTFATRAPLSTVPVPATALLLASGLGAAVLRARPSGRGR